MIFENFVSNVDTDQCWDKSFLFLWPSTTSVDQFVSHLFTVSSHVINLKIDGSFNFVDCKFFARWCPNTLAHHLFLQERTELLLILSEVILLDTDFHHNLLLKWHSDFLDLSHTLGDHSKILIKVLISFLFVIFFSVFFKVLGEFEDFLFGSIKWKTKDGFNIFKGRILKIDLWFDFFDFVVKIKFRFLFFDNFWFDLMFIVIAFIETFNNDG